MISRTMQAGCLAAAGVFVATSVASAAVSDINGVFPLLRTPFNAYPDSDLTFTDNLASTGTVSFNETNFGFPDVGAPNALNRHNAFFSDDAGSTPREFLNQEGFVVSFDLNLDSTITSPRKEAGIFTSSALTGSGFFIVTTDNGEIATFSSFFPFTSNTSDDGNLEFGAIPYVPGTDVNLKMVYRPGIGSTATGDLTVPASLEFIVNGISAGRTALGNLENGIDDGMLMGLYLQSNVPFADSAATTVDATFNNIQIFDLLAGDLDANGFVDILDLNIVLANWNTDGSADARADTDLNGLVDILDLNVVLTDWNQGTPPAAGSVVPEPASLALLGLGAAGMLRRRHR